MLDGVDRVVDLTGPRASGLTGAAIHDVVSAVQRCDTAALARTDGHFAAMGQDGRTVRLARTIGIPLRYFVAKMYHGPFLVVSDRIDRIFEWCNAQRIGWQFDPAYTRMIPAHYVVELDQVGCPDPVPRYHRFFTPPEGRGADDLDAAGETYVAAASAAVRHWLAAGGSSSVGSERPIRSGRIGTVGHDVPISQGPGLSARWHSRNGRTNRAHSRNESERRDSAGF